MDASSILNAGGASLSPSSPVSSRHGNGGPKRKRSSIMGGVESSPGSGNDDDHGDKKRQPGVKRACNECRQQKVSCPSPVSADPFHVKPANGLLTGRFNSCDAM